MRHVSQAYKQAMKKMLRDRAFISVTLGVVNGVAQEDSAISSTAAYWSEKDTPFNTNEQSSEYATFEQNFVKADGSFLIMPTEDETTLLNDVGYCTPGILGAVTIDFGNSYAIKGLTIDFGEAYPTEFVLTTDVNTTGTTYTNSSSKFVTYDTLGEISTLTITPSTMVGGNQRLRIKRIVMGVGLSYSDDSISKVELSEEVSAISEDLPNTSLKVTVLDKENLYNVNNTDSFIDYLITGQVVTVAFGMTLDEDTNEIEWLKTQTLSLTDWSSKDGQFSFSSSDLFATLTDKYTLGNTIHTRTAYEEAVSILTDAGFEADEYEIDNYLNDITLTNPMPEDTHANCLLLLCNVCRCIFFQDGDGIIHIQGNFALVLEPEDITLDNVGATDYSTPRNILTSGAVTTHYADLSVGYTSADGSMKILPTDSADYDGNTGYVSSEVADSDGNFTTTPSLTMTLEAGYTYYGLYLNFKGQPPQKVTISTSYNGTAVDTYTFDDLENENILSAEFNKFDVMTVEFTKGSPNSRIVVDYMSLGNITDYLLDKDTMTSNLIGTKEELVKDVKVKIYTYVNDSENNPQEVEDDVWYTNTINSQGVHQEVSNPLIDNSTLAQDVAEWLGSFYGNNFSYEVSYRGDPRLNAADIIKLEDEYINNLQVSIGKATLSYNGAFSGKLDMRRAMRS